MVEVVRGGGEFGEKVVGMVWFRSNFFIRKLVNSPQPQSITHHNHNA